jgi:hypothetical protein
MSKISRPILRILVSTLILLPAGLAAQGLIAKISIRDRQPAKLVVEGQYESEQPQTDVRFLDSFGSLTGLSERISNVRLGDEIAPHGPGRSHSIPRGTRWSYTVDISPMKDRFAAAHLSRSDERGALVVLDDILPQADAEIRSGLISFDLPAGWEIFTSEPKEGTAYRVADLENAVFFAGPAYRNRVIKVEGSQMNLTISGEWLFNDDEAAEMAAAIFASYKKLFEGAPPGRIQIAITPFPHSPGIGHWEAGSRGNSITIVSSDMPFRNQSLQRLHEQLRHELFHLWIPNGTRLTGDYDWFFEGFALYQSLKIGVAANRIRFDDMLDTLSRAYEIGGRGSNMSLSRLSGERWKGSNTQVYARGMLVAFAADLAILHSSKGRRSVEDLVAAVYENNRSGPSRPADDALKTAFAQYNELRHIYDRNVADGDRIDLVPLLNSAGLGLDAANKPSKITVADKLSGSQKKILDRLGYNNWRKVSGNN